MRPSIHTAPAVLNRMTAFTLNCNGLRVNPWHSNAQRLTHGLFGRIGRRQSCVATHVTTDYKTFTREEQKQKQQTRVFEPQSLFGKPAPPVTANRRRQAP